MDQPWWWQRGVVYQIYPRSFQDSNGDGVGDLQGITRRLAYLEWLGVDAIWISPIFPSPMADFGYDVADYCDIEPLFGTLADFDALVSEAHRRNVKVILDYVPNHTSDRHAWFIDSRSSRSSDRRDWYIWSDASPPNNWLSVFGGSAWEWDASTSQSYYHAYLKEQPDLNWRNADVQKAMDDVLRFWFDRGVDGVRIDALRQLVKDRELRDNPPNPDWQPGEDPYRTLLPLYTADQPEVLEHVARWRELTDGYPERVLIGELWLPIERLVTYYGVDGRGLHLPFNFHLILTAWQATMIAALVEQYEAALPEGAWPNWVLGNHDRARIATRVGSAQARVASMLLLTLRGTPTIYQGDELGIANVPIPPERVQDPVEDRLPGLGLGRDSERTPMQWDATPNAGFCPPEAQPWLPLAADHATSNVATQRDDPRSMLSLHRRLIEMRRAMPALTVGSYRTLAVDEHVFAYRRENAGQRVHVALNLSAEPRALQLPPGTVLLSTYLDRGDTHTDGVLRLRANEGVILG
ncbi:MAG TPA: alpha-amylase family glycosyl hydrolase [Chloroflexota bacterium]|nr:alpha-amylase family glycosyl hydrolase [Chloroflexota bacterium]